MYRWAYIILDIILGLFWLVFFITRKSLHKQMLIMSILTGLLGPIAEFWFYQDYWRPGYLFTFHAPNWVFGIETFVWPFFIGGLGGVLYEALLAKKMIKSGYRNSTLGPGLLFLVGLGVLIFLNNIIKINSIYACSIGFIISSLIIWLKRRDLVVNSLLSGLFVAILMLINYILWFIFYSSQIVDRFWMLKNLSGVFILGVPIEELIWGFSWGMIAGPLYEFWQGMGEKHKNKHLSIIKFDKN